MQQRFFILLQPCYLLMSGTDSLVSADYSSMINIWFLCIFMNCIIMTRRQFVLCQDYKKIKLVNSRSVSSTTCLILLPTKWLQGIIFSWFLFGCSNIKNDDVPYNDSELVARSVQDCNIVQRDSREPDKMSHLHLEKSIFNTTTYSQICFQELYTSAADYLG